MPSATTSSFTLTIPLAVNPADVRRLNDRFSCATRLNNVMIQHARRIVLGCRADPDWARARTMPQASLAQRKVRSDLFQAVRQRHGFNKAKFDAIVCQHAKRAGFYGRLGTHEMQAIAAKVFKAAEQWLLGKRGPLRFKGKRRPVHSVSGKNNSGMLQWKADAKVLQVENGWCLPAVLLDLGKDEWLWSALQARTKYCRLLWKIIRGERRWFVQLVQEGQAPIKARLLASMAGDGTIGGIDLGPGSLAWVSDTGAGLIRLCAEIDRPTRAIRRIQRRIDRQRRAANPDNFKADGTPKRGGWWVASNRQQQNERQLAELQRQEAAIRKDSHGVLINFLLTQALVWRDDGVSPKALQKRYGKAIGKCAPGLLMSELTRKAERAGGAREVIDIRNLKTSQYDHTTDDFEKKPLSQRRHVFRDGRGWVQRDIYSAFLAKHSMGSTHNPIQLETAWTEMTSLLRAAGLCDIKMRADCVAVATADHPAAQSVLPASLI